MDDFKWIQDISCNKIKTIELLNSVKKRLPKSYANSFHKRRDTLESVMLDIRTLHGGLALDRFNYSEDEINTLGIFIGRLSDIENHIDLGFSHCRDKWIQKHLKTSTRNIVSSIDKYIKRETMDNLNLNH